MSLHPFDKKKTKNSTGMIDEFKVKTEVRYDGNTIKKLDYQSINYKIFKKMSGIYLGEQQVFHLTIEKKKEIGYCYFAKQQPILNNPLIKTFFEGKIEELENLQERLDNAVKLPKPNPAWIAKNPYYEPVDDTDVNWINTEMNFLYNSFLEYLYTLGVDSNDLLLSLFPDGTDKITTYDDVIIENKEDLFKDDKENFTIQSLFKIFIENTQNNNPLNDTFKNRIDEIKKTINLAIENDLRQFFSKKEDEIRKEIGKKNNKKKIEYFKKKFIEGFITNIDVKNDFQHGKNNPYIKITFKLTEKEKTHTFDINVYPPGNLEEIKNEIEQSSNRKLSSPVNPQKEAAQTPTPPPTQSIFQRFITSFRKKTNGGTRKKRKNKNKN